MRVDIHQHLFTEPVLAALGRRDEPPRLVRRDRSWALELAGEPESPVAPPGQALERRMRELHADRIDRAVLCPSLPLGVEGLAPDEARVILAAYLQGAAELPSASRRGARSRAASPTPRRCGSSCGAVPWGWQSPHGCSSTPPRAQPSALRSRPWSALTRP